MRATFPQRRVAPSTGSSRRGARTSGRRASLCAAAALLAALLSACGGPATPGGPLPSAVEPRGGHTSVATPVVVRGEGFFTRVRQSLAGSSPELDEGYRAWLGGVELQQVRRLDSTRLSAVVPQGIPAGRHALEVTGPYGEARLEDAYEASDLAPAQLNAHLELPPEAPVGLVLRARLTLTNTGARAAGGLSVPPPELSSNLALVASPTLPSALAAGESATFEWQLRVVSAGPASASWRAAASDPVSGEALAAQASGEVVCRAQGIAGELVATPAEVSVGQDFEVRLRATCFGPEDCHAVTVTATPAGTAAVQPLLLPTPLELGANSSAELTFVHRATAAGSLVLTFDAAGTFGAAGEPVQMVPFTAALAVRQPAALSASASAMPARPRKGAEVAVELLVRNGGEAPAEVAVPTLLVSGAAVLNTATAPAAGVRLAGGAEHRFLWRLVAEQIGDASFALAAAGVDGLSDAAVAASANASATVREPAALAATWQLPSVVEAGEAFEVRLLVENTGGTDAREVAVTALARAGTSSAVETSGPAPLSAATIPAGGAQTFTWTLEAGALPGTLLLSAEALGTDAEDGLEARTGPVAAPAIDVLRPAALEASLSLPSQAVCDEPVAVTLTVTNPGDAEARLVTPTLTLGGTAVSSLLDGPVPASATIPGGESASFVWNVRPDEPGTANLSASVTGQDAHSLAELSAAASGESAVRRRATLTATWQLPATSNAGQAFDAVLTVTNAGTTGALGVSPSPPAVSGTAAATLGPLTPAAPQDIPAGESRAFTWSCLAGATAGELTLTTSAQGTDAIDGAPASLAPTASAPLWVQVPAALAAAMAGGSKLVFAGESFTLDLVVSNTGGATARQVAPALQPDLPGAVTLLSGPEPALVDVLAGAPVTFTWTWQATTNASIVFTGSASGTDANTGVPVAAPESTLSVQVGEASAVASDPLGDGTSFAFVFAHAGQLYLGPNETGSGAVRMNPDGSAPQSVSFAIAKDVSGSGSASSAAGPFASVGFTGCTANSDAATGCGPDNENGRGLFASGILGGQSWLFAAGARSAGRLTYVYLSPDSGPLFTFRYVDLSNGQMLGPQTKGISAVHAFGDRLYMGFPDTSNNRPFLVTLLRGPPAPGLDATPITDAISLEAGNMPGVGDASAPVASIDAMTDFNDRLYLFNDAGCTRSAKTQPDRYSASQADWAKCTPAAPSYAAKTGQTTAKTADLEPADKAFPQVAVWQGRLYAARNTTTGPQLWSCTPGTVSAPAPATATDCDPGDWSLVAPNGAGDLQLTQFDNPANAKITLLLATAHHLFVGYDNAGGATVFRTSSPAPASRADFVGAGTCSAADHPASCAGIGGAGLGDPLNTRIFQGAALTFGTEGYVYVTAGNGTGPVKVIRLPE